MALMSVEFKLSLLQLTIDFIKKKKKSKCDKICSQLKLNVLFLFLKQIFFFLHHMEKCLIVAVGVMHL